MKFRKQRDALVINLASTLHTKGACAISIDLLRVKPALLFRRRPVYGIERSPSLLQHRPARSERPPAIAAATSREPAIGQRRQRRTAISRVAAASGRAAVRRAGRWTGPGIVQSAFDSWAAALVASLGCLAGGARGLLNNWHTWTIFVNL